MKNSENRVSTGMGIVLEMVSLPSLRPNSPPDPSIIKSREASDNINFKSLVKNTLSMDINCRGSERIPPRLSIRGLIYMPLTVNKRHISLLGVWKKILFHSPHKVTYAWWVPLINSGYYHVLLQTGDTLILITDSYGPIHQTKNIQGSRQ